MRSHIAFVLIVRGCLLVVAGFLFAAALVLAGLSPLFK
jgi:hypothetical protein